ncbi:hypothetical protein ACLOJK_021418 [Asimina triloba]
MSITYGFGTAASVVFSSYIFLLVPEQEYQAMLYLENRMRVHLPNLGIDTCVAQRRVFKYAVPFTNRWALAYAGFSLVQNYGTNLFDAIDSNSNLNGHILAASQAAGSLGSFCALYLENFAIKSGIFVYVLGSAIMGIICSWLLIETLLQVTFVALGLSVFAQFICFAGFFFFMTAIFSVVCLIANRNETASAASECEPELLIAESMETFGFEQCWRDLHEFESKLGSGGNKKTNCTKTGGNNAIQQLSIAAKFVVDLFSVAHPNPAKAKRLIKSCGIPVSKSVNE